MIATLGSLTGLSDNPEFLNVACTSCFAKNLPWQLYAAKQPYILADNGYDVWIGNARGSKFGRSSTFNENPSSNDQTFFDYYAYDFATKDTPAIVDVIRNQTNVDKIFYVGSSLSSQTGLMFLSFKPEYNDRIQGMALIAPSVRLNCHTTKVSLKTFMKIYPIVDVLEQMTHEFPVGEPNGVFCKFAFPICKKMFEAFTAHGKNQNSSRVAIFAQHMPTATSMKTLKYMAQNAYESCNAMEDEEDEYNVHLFDYDLAKGPLQDFEELMHLNPTNKEVYGSDTPPVIPFKNIRAPLKFYRGTKDEYVYPPEIERLKKMLPSLTGTYYLDNFSHIDSVFFVHNASHAYDMVKFFDGYTTVCTKVEGQSYEDMDKPSGTF